MGDLITDVVEQQAFDQVEKLKKGLDELLKRFNDLASLGVNLGKLGGGGGGSISGLSELEKIMAKIVTTQEKLNVAQSAEAKQLADLTIQLNAVNQANKEYIKNLGVADGSMKGMELKMAALNKEIKLLDLSTTQGAEKFKQMSMEYNKLHATISQHEQSMGNFRRNVGNYASAYNGMSLAISQVAREMPNFAQSVQIGLMSLTNNIGGLVDGYKGLVAQNERLKQSGEKTIPIWKGISSAIFSWNTLIMVGVTLLTMYSKEIMNLITGVSDLQEILGKKWDNDGVKKAQLDVDEMRQTFKLFHDGLMNKDEALRIYNEKLGDVFGHYDDIKKAEDAFNTDTEAYIQMVAKRTQAHELLNLAQTKQIEINNLQEKPKPGMLDSEWWKWAYSTLKNKKYGEKLEWDEYVKIRTAELKKEIEDAINLSNKNAKEAIELGNKAGVKTQAEIDAEEKAKQAAKKAAEERARLTAEIDKLMAEDRYKLMDELNSKLLKLEDKYHEEIAKMRKAKYGDEALAEKAYLKEREDIISSYVDKQKELMQRLWQNGKKIAEEAVKEGFTDPFGLTVAVRSGNNRANTLRGGSWEERDTSKGEKKSLNDKIRELQEISQQVGNLFSAINDAITNGVNKRFNHEISLIDERERAELDSLERMSLGDKERYEKKKKIELEAEARRKKLEHDRIADLRRAAIFQKGIDIAQIITNVALQVTKKGITTPQAIAALLEGTALIAKVVATPIPQYAKGTDNHIGGAAIVGEEGTELGILPSGKKFLTKNKPTLMNLPAKTKIIPHDQLIQSIYHNALIRMSEMGGVSSTDGMQEALIASVNDLKGEMHDIKDAILKKDMTVKLYGDVSKYAHLQRQLR